MEGNGKEDFIKVSVRIRPPDESLVGDTGTICLKKADPKTLSLLNRKETKTFSFDVAFDCDATQEYVFTSLGKHIIDGCIDGYNGTIFAYGQTGSGKTYTMVGPSEQDSGEIQRELRGLIPRSLEYLFLLIQRKKDLCGESVSFLCRCSFVELYQEQVFDLLDPASSTIIREDIKKGVYVQGAHEDTASTAAEAYEVLMKGWRNRRVASTAMNRESSRSHAIFAISIESREWSGGIQNIKVARLNLVDLAGSERQKDASTSGQRLKEAGCINNSLTVLGRVMNCLVSISQGKERFIPYRESRLTFLLRDSLGGNARTCIVCNVHPHSKCYGESLSTLQFADNAKRIRNKAVVNEDVFGQGVEQLQEEIRRLKTENRRLLLSAHTTTSPLHGVLPPSGEDWDSECLGKSPVASEADLFEALTLLKREQVEKETLGKVVKILQECNAGKDKQLLSNQFILKLRDSRIQSLEKALKDREISTPTMDALRSDLMEEMEKLKKQLEHQPSPVMYRRQNEELRRQMAELKNMEGEGRSRDALMSRLQWWKQMRASPHPSTEHVHDGISETGSSVEDGDEIVEVEELRQKNQTLEYEIEKLKRDLEDEKRQRGEEMERNKRSLEEVRRAMAAGNIRRELMNSIHEDAIKALTPPQSKQALRSARKARRTTLFTPGTGTSEAPQASSLTPSRGLLKPLDERIEDPDHDAETAGATLSQDQMVDHIRSIEKLNSEQEGLITKLEGEKLTMETDNNRLQQQVGERQIRINTLQEESDKREATLCQQMADLELRLREATEGLVELERTRQKLTETEKMCGTLERDMEKRQKEWDSQAEKQRKEMARMENEAFNRASELNSATQQRDDALEEKTELKKALENQSAELESLREEVEKQEESRGKLKLEVDRLRNLRSSTQLLEVYDEIEGLRSAKEAAQTSALLRSEELRAAQAAYMEGVERERQLKGEMEEVRRDLEGSERAREAEEERTGRLEKALERQEAHIQELEQSLHAQVKEKESKVDELLRAITEKDRMIQEKDDLNIDARKELEDLRKQNDDLSLVGAELKMEVERLIGELGRTREKCSALEDEEALEAELQRMDEECVRLKNLNEESCRLAEEFQKSATEKDDVLEKLRSELESERRVNREAKSQAEVDFRKKIQELERELGKMKKRVSASVSVSSEIKRSNEEYEDQMRGLREEVKKEKDLSSGLHGKVQAVKDTNQRLEWSEKRMFQEVEGLKSKLEMAQEEKHNWKEKYESMCGNLDAEIKKNSELAGHANHNQKIRYMEGLRGDIKRLNKENADLKQKLSAAPGSSSSRRGANTSNLSLRGKENARPRK